MVRFLVLIAFALAAFAAQSSPQWGKASTGHSTSQLEHLVIHLDAEGNGIAGEADDHPDYCCGGVLCSLYARPLDHEADVAFIAFSIEPDPRSRPPVSPKYVLDQPPRALG